MIDKEPDSAARESHAGIALTGLALSVAFLLLLLVIVNSSPTGTVQVQQSVNSSSATSSPVQPSTNSAPADKQPSSPQEPAANSAPANPVQQPSGPVQPLGRPRWLPWILWIFTTRRSAFVYETLISGMLGAYLGEISRSADVTATAKSPEYTVHFRAALFLGGTAAIVTGVVLPLVVFDSFEGPGINSWTLVAAGGVAGNLARGAFSRMESTIARLLTSFESRFDRTTISESVKTGIHEAFAVPQPINYEGFLAADVTRSNESVIAKVEEDGRVAQVRHGEAFELRVQFAPEKSIKGFSEYAVVKPISIRGFDDTPPTVTFRLLVDFGFVDVPPEERVLTMPRHGPSALEKFVFSVPIKQVPDRLDGSVAPHEGFQPEICVSVYQHSRYFDSVVLPVVLQA